MMSQPSVPSEPAEPQVGAPSEAEQALRIEGLAAQLYAASKHHGAYVWWHLLRDEIKLGFRHEAERRIALDDARRL